MLLIRRAAVALLAACTLCTATAHAQCGSTVENQFLRLRKVAGSESSRFFYVGTVPAPPAIDPITTGLQLTVAVPDAGITTIDVTISPGAYSQVTNRGWTGNGTVFAYRDSHGIYGGIMRVLVKTMDTGSLKILLFGKNGSYPLPLTTFPTDPRDDPFDLEFPAVATFVLDPTQGAPCAEGVMPTCRYRNRGGKLLCF